ncbi:uncharacterized protein LOC125014502 [Mugil cephalus]|uniref:uncharacterized protein LOC125014502 n=1 Tax=Mugil cephalus TaxID=48193 RepID=UPI001FB708B3|nr:uncharacterized protein LOC125014502 [Mugil cephalus]
MQNMPPSIGFVICSSRPVTFSVYVVAQYDQELDKLRHNSNGGALCLNNKQPVLSVSPSWLSPGASVTLSCELRLEENFHSPASLTVNPDRVQHFTSDSVSLSCEGNSTEWRVRRFTDDGVLSHCSTWGTMTGSTCKLSRSQSDDAVYWCESGSGEFSNAVNITVHADGIILVSPVHPVTEGRFCFTCCKLKTQNVLSTGEELKHLHSVKVQMKGFYKCQSPGKQSPQSWMAVT